MKPLTVFAKARREGRSFVGGGGKPAGAVARVFYGAATPLSRTCEPAATGASRLQRKRCLPGPVLPGSHRWLIAVLAAAILLGRVSLPAPIRRHRRPRRPRRDPRRLCRISIDRRLEYLRFQPGRANHQRAGAAGRRHDFTRRNNAVRERTAGLFRQSRRQLSQNAPRRRGNRPIHGGAHHGRRRRTRAGREAVVADGRPATAPSGGRRLDGDRRLRVERVPAANGAPAIPADASDVLRRLMEQRQKQLKQ